MTEGEVSEAEGRLHTGSWEDVVLWEKLHTIPVQGGVYVRDILTAEGGGEELPATLPVLV